MNLPKQYPNDTQAAKGLSQLKNAPTRPKNHNGEWTRETSKPRNEDRPLPNPQWQSRQPHTVEADKLDSIIEIAIEWQGYYDEAMEALPSDTRKFVESTSWAAELHKDEKIKLLKQDLIAWSDSRNTQAQELAKTEARIEELTHLASMAYTYWNDDPTVRIIKDRISQLTQQNKELQNPTTPKIRGVE